VKLIFDNGSYRSMKLIDAGGVIAEAVAGPLPVDEDLMLRE